MTRYKMVGDKMVAHPDGEWVMYEEHVEDVKNIVYEYEDMIEELLTLAQEV